MGQLALVLACLALLQATAAQESGGAFVTFSEYEAALDQAAAAAPALTVLEPSTGSADLSAALAKLTATATSSPTTKWPEYNPPGPYFFDTLCFGRFTNTCLKSSPNCQWYTSQDPSCYDKRFVSVTAPNRVPVPYHVRFFQFNFGVHLVEGTFFKRFYSITVDECAKLCIKAAGGFATFPQQKRRCLSFDFYPFETWMSEAPYYESQERGICALNSDTKNTARMRNEDQGFTDAEYYYHSHCSRRPFNPAGGYYEVRDPRGTLTPLLEYAGPTSLGLEAPWGGSRWGIFHPNMAGYLPTPLVDQLQCSTTSSSDTFNGPVFRGGFTPISDDQHCPGLMTKSEARELCVERGGTLCNNQSDLNAISGRKLGCAFDQAGNGQIWHEGRPDVGKMWPRCCATYVMPLSNSPALEESGSFQDACTPYQKPNIDFCDQFKTVTSCVYSHTPDDPASANPTSWRLGSGRGLDQIRNLCLARSLAIPGYNCSQMDVEFWKTATNCIWCPQAGLDPVGGSGQCRAGGDFGICPTAANNTRTVFGIRARSTCPEMTNCVLITKYPDLAPFMGNYTFVNDTDSAWKDPFANAGDKLPTKKATRSPSARPTKRPTNAPSKKPSKAPTQQPSKKVTEPPTSKPSTATPTKKTATGAPFTLPDFGASRAAAPEEDVTITAAVDEDEEEPFDAENDDGGGDE